MDFLGTAIDALEDWLSQNKVSHVLRLVSCTLIARGP